MFIKEDLMNTRASSSFRNLAGLQNPVYSEDLELHYQFHRNRGVLEFEDGVEYTVRESLIISRGRPKPEELKKLHEIKKIFNGEFLTKEDLQERELFYGADQTGDTFKEDKGTGKKENRTSGKEPAKTSDKGIGATRKASARKQKYRDPLQTSLWACDKGLKAPRKASAILQDR